jgi:hypothetical protein
MMRKLLILSILALLTAGASGCAGRNSCGESWRPGYYLFGAGRSHNQQNQNQCCDPCAGGSGGNVSYGTVGYGATEMMGAPTSSCCN